MADVLPVEEIFCGVDAGVIDIVFTEGEVEGFTGLTDEFAGNRGNGEFQVILAGEVAGDLGVGGRIGRRDIRR